METTTSTPSQAKAAPAHRRVSTDLLIGLSLLGVVIMGRLLWAVSDGSLLAVLGAR